MRPLAKVAVVILASVALYLGLFAFIATKPMSIGFYYRLFESKATYADSINGPKILVMGGSNSFYSVRCEAIEAATNKPCVNLAVTVAFGRNIMLAQLKRLARRGDVILMPLEFRLYRDVFDSSWFAIGAPYTFTFDRSIFVQLRPETQLHYAFSFDMRYLLASIVENVQWWSGARARENFSFQTRQGDRKGHPRSVRTVLPKQESMAGGARELDLDGRLAQDYIAFFQWAGRAGVTVIGTFPASIDEIPISDAAVARLKDLYAKGGQRFETLRNRSQYPRDCFFDTAEHLVEECQVEHSRSLAREFGLAAAL